MWSLLSNIFVLFSLVTAMGSLFQSCGKLFFMSYLSSFLLDDLRLLFSFNLIKSLVYLGISVFSAVCIIFRVLYMGYVYMDMCLKVRNLSFFLYNVMCVHLKSLKISLQVWLIILLSRFSCILGILIKSKLQ